jgi:hypothetical protein
LIADKTQDVFLDGVYYDLQFSVLLSVTGVELALHPFAATALGLVWHAEGASADGAVVAALLSFNDGSQQTLALPLGTPRPPYFHVRLGWGTRKVPVRLQLRALTSTPVVLRGLSSIDETNGTFLAHAIIPDLRIVHSGDVKIYERASCFGRVVLRMANGALSCLRDVGGMITDDQPEFVRIMLPGTQHAKALILRDTCFPGWVARVDGVEAPIACEEVLFRSVALPAGAREVVFTYQPASLRIGAALSAVGLVIWLVLVAALIIRQRT